MGAAVSGQVLAQLDKSSADSPRPACKEPAWSKASSIDKEPAWKKTESMRAQSSVRILGKQGKRKSEQRKSEVIFELDDKKVLDAISADTGKQKAVFADAAEMKDRVRQAITKKEYNVFDFYKTEGVAQALARHTFFEYFTLLIIGVNAIWISVDVDLNDEELLLDAHPVFQVAEHLFCLYFSFEWIVRFAAFQVKRNGFRDAWFIFDSILVLTMILETWIMTLVVFLMGGSSSTGLGNTSVLKLVRLVRLTRMARMAKLLRAIPELIVLIKGIFVASRSVFFTLVLLILGVYFFAIVFRQLTADSDIGDEYFSSVPASMSSLLLDGVLPDQAQLVRDCAKFNKALGLLALIFILISSLTVMNMLVGVLCEVVSVVSAVEKEQLTVNYVKHRLLTILGAGGIDADGSMSISKFEFEGLLTNNDAARIIQEMGVDVVGLVDFAEIIFGDGTDEESELSFADFIELVLQLRGSNVCTVKDVVDLRKFVVGEMNVVEEKISNMITDLAESLTNGDPLSERGH